MNLNELVAETRRLEARLREKGLHREERAILKAQLAAVREHHGARVSGAMSAIEAAKLAPAKGVS
jgi:hypothetical protein